MDKKVLDSRNFEELANCALFAEVLRALREFVWRQEYRKDRYAEERTIMKRAKEEGWITKKR